VQVENSSGYAYMFCYTVTKVLFKFGEQQTTLPI